MNNSKYTTNNIDSDHNNVDAKLEIVEKQLARAKQNTAVLMKKLSQAE